MELSLPLGRSEIQCLGILRNRAFGLVLSPIGKVRLDFDTNLDVGVRIYCQDCKDFLRNLHQSHLGGCWRDHGRPHKRLGFHISSRVM